MVIGNNGEDDADRCKMIAVRQGPNPTHMISDFKWQHKFGGEYSRRFKVLDIALKGARLSGSHKEVSALNPEIEIHGVSQRHTLSVELRLYL